MNHDFDPMLNSVTIQHPGVLAMLKGHKRPLLETLWQAARELQEEPNEANQRYVQELRTAAMMRGVPMTLEELRSQYLSIDEWIIRSGAAPTHDGAGCWGYLGMGVMLPEELAVWCVTALQDAGHPISDHAARLSRRHARLEALISSSHATPLPSVGERLGIASLAKEVILTTKEEDRRQEARERMFAAQRGWILLRPMNDSRTMMDDAYAALHENPELLEFLLDLIEQLPGHWREVARTAPLERLTPHWPPNKQQCAQRPDYARTYMHDTAKSAADLFITWANLRGITEKVPVAS